MKIHVSRCVTVTLAFAATVMAMPSPASASTYDAVTGFQKKYNPSGPWSYLAGGKLLKRREIQNGDRQVRFWWNGEMMPQAAIIGRNFGSTPYQGNTVVIYPDHLDMDPENVPNTDVRFTAPLTGTYTFKGDFKGTDRDEASHQVAVVLNGTTVYTGTISNFGELVTFSGRTHLRQGDTIDFVNLSNGGETDLSTGLKVDIAGH